MADFNFCVPAVLFPHGQPLFGLQGLTVIKIFGVGAPMIILSLYVLGIWNFMCAAWTRYPSLFSGLFSTGKEPRRRSSLRSAIFLYQAITGVFFIALQSQLNKMVVLMAAMHNWCEWIILGNVYIGLLNSFGMLGTGVRGITTWNKIFTLWVMIVMIGILLIDDVLKSFAFEEVVGLWPDFQLFFISLFCWWKFRKTQDSKGVFWQFFAAAFFHLAQIFLLLFEGMGIVSPWPTAQVGIMLTAFFNYAFYTMFALALDNWQENVVGEAQSVRQFTSSEEGQVSPTAAQHAEENTEGKPQSTPQSLIASAFVPTVPVEVAQVRTCRLVGHMFGCLVLSSFFVLTPPLVLGECVKPIVETTGPFFNWTTFHFNKDDELPSQAFQNSLAESMMHARHSQGNLMSKVFFKSGHAFRFDKWQDEQSASTFYESDPGLMRSLHNDDVNVLEVTAASSTWHQLEAVGNKNDNFTVPQDSSNMSTFCLSTTTSGYTHLRINEEYHDAVKNKMAYMPGQSREEGANYYLSSISATDAGQFLVVEQWEDENKLRHHLMSPDVLRLLALSKTMTHKDGMNIEGSFRELVPCS